MLKAGVARILSVGCYRLPHGAHVTRYSMYKVLSDSCQDGSHGRGKPVLVISGSEQLASLVGFDQASLVNVEYPEYNILDLHHLDGGQYDAVVSDQVLEHVEGDPQQAFNESLRLLKPGGLAVHATCFINPIHGAPSDFWRFTPEALKWLARDFSEILYAGGWGNRRIWVLDWLGLRFKPIPHARWHPLHNFAVANNELWPVVTWVIARK